MRTETIEKVLLFSDETAEKKNAAKIIEQKGLIEKAVQAFNEVITPALKADELQYFLSGHEDWCLVRWQDSQVMPDNWPKNASRQKFIDMLDLPDFSSIGAATRRCSMLAPGLFHLGGATITINEEAMENYIFQNRIYVESDQIEKYERLQELKKLLIEFNLLHLPAGGASYVIQPVDVSQIGLRYSPHAQGDERFYFDPQRLKEFLR